MLVEIERRFHTWMAYEALAELEAFGALPPEDWSWVMGFP
jgi:hypothetical protein